MFTAETQMDLDRITHPVRLAKGSHQPGSGKGCAMNVISYSKRRRGSLVIGKVLLGAVGAAIAIGLAAPAGASPVIPQPQAVPDFLAAARAAGITGTDPAMLEDGYSVCRRLWVRHMPGTQIAAALVHDNPQLTTDQAAQFVLAAYHDLCPVPGGSYDYWAYSTG
jgi:Protein of unknown function (DUF732)